MEKAILEAIKRDKQSGKFREIGFVPGVIYGDTVSEATSVKFEATALKKILSRFGSNAKVWIKNGDEKKFGFIREIQRNPITGTVTHIDVQIVSKDQEIKLQIPIVYKGEDELRNIQLELQIYKSEINVLGKMALMPDTIYVDVSNKTIGDTITLADLDLDKQITVSEKEDVVYGIIANIQEIKDVEEEAEEIEEIKTEV